MANPEHLKLIKQDVEVWNQWRKDNPEERPDLWGANLRGLNLREANLERADCQKANLQKANLREANLREANLREANLEGANLGEASLGEAQLGMADLKETHLRWADLRGADLKGADLRGANLSRTNLREANITGVMLWGAVRNDWLIENIICEYVFWVSEGKQRTPTDRDFRPGEFEELYKHLPTIEYYFEHGFTPIDAVVMDRVVQAINEQHPEFELNLLTLDSRGQPHVTFTVIHKDYAEEALEQIRIDYEAIIKALETERDLLDRFLTLAIKEPRSIIKMKDILGKVSNDGKSGTS